MNQRVLTLLIGLLLTVGLPSAPVLGQRIRLGELPLPLCAGSSVPVSFTVNEPFGAGNSFRVEIVSQNREILAVSPNALPGGFIQLPGTLSPNPVAYRLRIAASNPIAYSNDVLLVVNAPPTATLQPLPTADASLNPGEPLRVPVTLTGGGPYSLSFSNGTTFDVDDLTQMTLRLFPDQTQTYRLTAVTNACGAGRAGGQVTASVRAAGLLVTRLSTTEPCAGKPLDIFFSTDRQLPATTSYKVDFESIESSRTYTVTATGNTSPLRVQLPTSLANDVPATGLYRLRLYSETANVSAYYRNALSDGATPIRLHRPPAVRLSGGATVGFGQVAQLTATVTGLGSGVITLSDGTAVSLATLEPDGPRLLPVRPGQTTTYQVRSISTSCGVYGPEAAGGSATVTVPPGYRIDSLSSSSVCAGQPVQVYFTTNEPLSTDAGSYQFRGGTVFSNNQLGGGVTDFTVQQITAGQTPNSGILTVVARPLPADYLTSAAYGPAGQLLVGSFYGQISRGGQVGSVYDKPLTVADKPQLLITSVPFGLNRPQPAFFSAQLAGHTYLTDVLLSDGTRLHVPSQLEPGQKSRAVILEALAGESSTFSVVGVQNSCGAGTAQGSVAVRVRSDTVALFMRPVPPLLCAGSPVSVSFAAVGNIGPVANYRVEITDEDGFFSGRYIGSGAGSPIAVTIPAGYRVHNRLHLRVVSSPASGTAVYQSAGRAFTYLNAAQVVRLSVAGTGGTETISRSGEAVMLRLLSDGRVPTTVTLSDGQMLTFADLSTDVPVRPAQTMTYTIRSVQNSCGAAVGTGTVTVRVQPFSVEPLLPRRILCEGDSLAAQLLVKGELPAQATHALQILLDGNVTHTLPARLTDNRLTANLPTSLSAGTFYGVRVLTTVGTEQVYSQPSATTFRLYRRPSLHLTPPNNQTAVVLDAGQASLTVQLTNPADPTATLLPSRYTYRINEQPYTSIDNVPVEVPVFANSVAPASYSITAVYDAFCGFGQATGAVRLSYRPGLRSLAINKTQFCRGGEQATVTYEVAGDFPTETRFPLFLINAAGVRTRVAESARQADRLTFTIDSTLAPGTYRVSLTLPAGLPPYESFPTITIGDRPTVIVAGGNSVQYADQPVSVGFRVPSGFLPVSMTLTNGLVQTLTTTENTLTFTPQQNTTYQIARVTNGCGEGRAGGVVSVTVLPPAATEIRVAGVDPQGGVTAICQGGSMQVSLSLKGPFAADGRFTVYLSDTTGQSYRPLVTRPLNATTLVADLPADVPAGAGYRVRVGASSPDVLGASSGTYLTVRPGLVAVMSGSANVMRDELTPVSITLNNTGPWSVTLANSIYGLETVVIDTSPFQYRVRPDQTMTYTLLGVANLQCGNGRVSGQAVLTTINPLAINPTLPLTARIMPNPTAGRVRVSGTLPKLQLVTLRLTDLAGRVLQTHRPGLLRHLDHELDLSACPAGTYLLTVEAETGRAVFKVVKE